MLICFRSCFFSSFLLLLTLKLYIPKRPTERTTQHSQAQTHQRSHAYFCTAVDEVSRSQSTSLSRRHLGGRPDPSPPQPTVKPFCCHRRPRPQPALPPRQQPLHQQPYPTLSKPPERSACQRLGQRTAWGAYLLVDEQSEQRTASRARVDDRRAHIAGCGSGQLP